MNKVIKYLPFISITFLIPFLAFAQDVASLIGEIQALLDPLVGLLAALATVVFIWGVVVYISAGGDETKRKDGQNKIIYGLIGLFILVAFWGIVNVLINTLNLDTGAPALPTLPA